MNIGDTVTVQPEYKAWYTENVRSGVYMLDPYPIAKIQDITEEGQFVRIQELMGANANVPARFIVPLTKSQCFDLACMSLDLAHKNMKRFTFYDVASSDYKQASLQLRCAEWVLSAIVSDSEDVRNAIRDALK